MKTLGRYVRYLLSASFMAGMFGLGIYTYQQTIANAQPAAPSPGSLVRFGSPAIGAADAKVEVVEFLDPACEGCRAFYPIVKETLAQYPGKVRLVVRHVAFHRGADYVIRVLEASRKQGKYWEALETLFAKQSAWAVNHTAQPAAVLASLSGLGLDMQRLQRDMNDPGISRLAVQDMADAKALKVVQTPDFYINGKQLQPFGVDEFRQKVREAVAAAYR